MAEEETTDQAADQATESKDATSASIEEALLEERPRAPRFLWEQWPGESDHWYSCFLIYLSLGTGRTLQNAHSAYYVNRKMLAAKAAGTPIDEIIIPQVQQHWRRAADRFHWEERAGRYDVYTLSQLVPQTVQIIFEAIGEFAKVTLDQLRSRTIQPTTWFEMQSTLEILASFISPEIIQETVRHSADYSGRVGIAAGGDDAIDGDIPPDPSNELEALD